MSVRVALVACAGFVAVAGGCAHRAGDRPSSEELQQTVQSLRAQNAAYAKQVEELENRVYILTDQLESRNVNAERAAAPELPRLTLRPGETAPQPEPPPDEATAHAGPDIEYSGEAARPSAQRPVLRLSGDETPIFASTRDAPTDARPMEIVREGTRPTPRPSATGMDAFALYRQGYDALKHGRHADAEQSLSHFLKRFSSHDLADNAQYWLGECHYDRKDYEGAVREFRRVVLRYPDGNKAPDALLKVGFSYLALGSTDAARQALEQVLRSYPKHPVAALAADRLKEIGR